MDCKLMYENSDMKNIWPQTTYLLLLDFLVGPELYNLMGSSKKVPSCAQFSKLKSELLTVSFFILLIAHDIKSGFFLGKTRALCISSRIHSGALDSGAAPFPATAHVAVACCCPC
jgi:hypothetical protein